MRYSPFKMAYMATVPPLPLRAVRPLLLGYSTERQEGQGGYGIIWQEGRNGRNGKGAIMGRGASPSPPISLLYPLYLSVLSFLKGYGGIWGTLLKMTAF